MENLHFSKELIQFHNFCHNDDLLMKNKIAFLIFMLTSFFVRAQEAVVRQRSALSLYVGVGENREYINLYNQWSRRYLRENIVDSIESVEVYNCGTTKKYFPGVRTHLGFTGKIFVNESDKNDFFNMPRFEYSNIGTGTSGKAYIKQISLKFDGRTQFILNDIIKVTLNLRRIDGTVMKRHLYVPEAHYHEYDSVFYNFMLKFKIYKEDGREKLDIHSVLARHVPSDGVTEIEEDKVIFLDDIMSKI